jgi:hypothetical protein
MRNKHASDSIVSFVAAKGGAHDGAIETCLRDWRLLMKTPLSYRNLDDVLFLLVLLAPLLAQALGPSARLAGW